MANKLEDMLNTMKLGDLIHRKDPMTKKRNTIICILSIVGAVALVAAIAYAVYRYMNRNYLDDFDDDFDDYEDDYTDDDLNFGEEDADKDPAASSEL